MPNTSMIDGIEGIKPSGTQIKNGTAMDMPSSFNKFLMAPTVGDRDFNG